MLPALRRNPTAVFLSAARRFGDVVYFRIGSRRGYLITNPADIRHVLQDNARNYHKSPLYDKLRMTLGNGLLTSEDEFWLRQRRIAQPAFHRQRLAMLAGVMADAARDAASEWQTIASSGEPVDVAQEMMRLTRTIVLRALLGADLGPFTAGVDQAWTIINERVGESFWSLGLTDRLPTPKYRRFRAAQAVLRGAVDHAISQRRRSQTDSADLLSLLLSARDEETGEAMTDEQLRVEVTTFLLAGQETTSLALTWTWYLLSQHPDAQRRLEEEIDVVLNGRSPEYDDLANLPYTRMVIDEAMRLYPPAWGFSRQALADDELGGFRLPRGMAGVHHPVRPAPASRRLGGPGGVRSRSLPARGNRGSAEIRVPAVRRGAASVHRQPFRAHRVATRRCDARATLPASARAGAQGRAVAPHHPSAPVRHADDDRAPDRSWKDGVVSATAELVRPSRYDLAGSEYGARYARPRRAFACSSSTNRSLAPSNLSDRPTRYEMLPRWQRVDDRWPSSSGACSVSD